MCNDVWNTRQLLKAVEDVVLCPEENSLQTLNERPSMNALHLVYDPPASAIQVETETDPSSRPVPISQSASLDRGVSINQQRPLSLQRYRSKRKRSSSVSCMGEGSVQINYNSSLCSHHDDLSCSSSFNYEENDCKAFSATDLDIREMIGKGFFGEVFKATHVPSGETLVVKRLYRLNASHERTFLKEVAVMRQLENANVLRFIGVLYKEKMLHLVTEFVAGGTLRYLVDNVSESISWFRRATLAKDIAQGMAYLHSMNIIHRDLNSGNVLIRDSDGSAVVADFGLSRAVEPHSRRRHTLVHSPYWMAPEMLKEAVYDQRVDQFSYGMTLWELISRCTTAPNLLARSDHFDFTQHYCQLCPKPFLSIAFSCASVDPEQRAPFCAIVEWLDVLCTLLSAGDREEDEKGDCDEGKRLNDEIRLFGSKSDTDSSNGNIDGQQDALQRRKFSRDQGYASFSCPTQNESLLLPAADPMSTPVHHQLPIPDFHGDSQLEVMDCD